jgi:hypothetical protein
MYNGVRIMIGEKEYILPPISLGQLRNGLLKKLQEHDKLIADGKLFDAMELRGQVILAALRRNYSDFPEEDLFAHLDLGNTAPIWLSILGASGFTSGEARAVTAVATDGTSAPSTEASPPPTDGPIAK